jgi:hypothetical protein
MKPMRPFTCTKCGYKYREFHHVLSGVQASVYPEFRDTDTSDTAGIFREVTGRVSGALSRTSLATHITIIRVFKNGVHEKKKGSEWFQRYCDLPLI